ncbi:hypothetical protein [Caulobacter sp. NIBR1757]|uniref:hypothetical protein n=1 Tax=Caulobacter sp. NIBR1757 TaxID=3016000 RepID=UPI0022F02D6C|nr:hypothetical protein [Caulobacter sp. NIBR1757]WGM38216.1 hypothetical protein AMEJIAPC_01118 [Caulobacter sp. NIBR1757]
MPNLIALVASFLATILLGAVVIRHPGSNRLLQASLVVLCSLTLLLALRFGGRIYPGLYVPESALLNAIFNGNGLFNGIGYGLVLLGAGLWLGSLLVRMRPELALSLKRGGWVLLGLAGAISLYGFSWATILGRLPYG